jgi:hypothetical protein
MLIELVAAEWRAARTGHDDQAVAVFDGPDHSPRWTIRSMIKICSLCRRIGMQPIEAARVVRGDLVPLARDADAPDVNQPQTKPRSNSHGVDDKISGDAPGGGAMASRQGLDANTPLDEPPRELQPRTVSIFSEFRGCRRSWPVERYDGHWLVFTLGRIPIHA